MSKNKRIHLTAYRGQENSSLNFFKKNDTKNITESNKKIKTRKKRTVKTVLSSCILYINNVAYAIPHLYIRTDSLYTQTEYNLNQMRNIPVSGHTPYL